MRRAMILAVALAGCGEMIPMRDYEIASKGMTKEDFEAPYSDNELRGAITTDVRKVWIPEAELHTGKATCPAVRFEGPRPFCGICKDAPTLKVFTLREDSPEKAYPQKQKAYLCQAEMQYWFHMWGGPDKLDTWLGPRRVRLLPRRGLPEEHNH